MIGKYTYNEILNRVRVTVVAMEKQQVFNIISVYVFLS